MTIFYHSASFPPGLNHGRYSGVDSLIEAERGVSDHPVLTRCGGCHPEDAGGEPVLAERTIGERFAAARREDPQGSRGAS